ncbi:MAG TPA: outer membrane beta-barrel protein [Terracidiphilus sp.]|nr:outer membrane beta-barrel protein [Terracidiphilus sp.]
MRARWTWCVMLCAGLALASAVAVEAQTDVALSVYGAFHGTTNGNGTIQSPANSAGGMIEVRHISNPLVGWEATYSYNRDNQVYSSACAVITCTSIAPQAVSANAHEISGDWIASVHIANLRPFGLAGVGLLFNQPTGRQSNTTSETKPVFVYGAGLDWGVFPHLGLRFQYRGNLYKAPDLTRLYTSTNAFTHTSEPMIGAYIRF